MRARTLAILSALAVAHSALGQVFSNTAPISIPDAGVATPFPATIQVSGMSAVESVAVVLNRLSHTYAGDLDILLVGPDGTGTLILSDAGASNAFNGGTYAFAVGGAPITASNGQIFTGTYVPTFTTGDDSFPGVVYQSVNSLGGFAGHDANGAWKLYIVDDTGGDFGTIADGWSLVFNSTASAAPHSNTFTYQGKLDGAQGPVDLRFTLFKTQYMPAALGPADWPAAIGNVMPDENGLFTVQVPFTPSLLNREARYLQVEVSPAGANSYEALTPRQPVLRTPFAAWASAAGSVDWSQIANMPATIADGVDDAGPWTVTGGNVLYTGAGKVGIGATSNHTFHVNSASVNSMRVHSTDQGGTTMIWTNSADTDRYGAILMTGPTSPQGGGNFIIRNWTYSNAGNVGIVLATNNNIGIGTYNPDFSLTVNGSAGKPGGGSWSNWSDARLKHDITPLTGTLDKLLNVRGVSFFYNEPEKIGELSGQRTGVVAQEVEKVFPEWVDVGASGYKSVTFRGFEALTIEALRDLRNEKDAQIKALRDENEALRVRLERLERAIESK